VLNWMARLADTCFLDIVSSFVRVPYDFVDELTDFCGICDVDVAKGFNFN
jgi:hypothetical protein